MHNPTATPRIPSVQDLVLEFDAPPEAWIDACYPVTCSIARLFPDLRARVVKGLWKGPVAIGSHFRWLVDAGFTPNGVAHWWLTLPDASIIDATRWVFEGQVPYVYHGLADLYLEDGEVSFPE